MADTCRKDIRDLIALAWIVRPRIRFTWQLSDHNVTSLQHIDNLSFGISSSSEDSEALGVEFLFLSASATVRPQRNKKKTFTEPQLNVQKKH